MHDFTSHALSKHLCARTEVDSVVASIKRRDYHHVLKYLQRIPSIGEATSGVERHIHHDFFVNHSLYRHPIPLIYLSEVRPLAIMLDEIFAKAMDYVKDYMSNYDASHDFKHVERVLKLAQTIEYAEAEANPNLILDPHVIMLSAVLHDVGDKKYLKPGEDASTLVINYLKSLDCPEGIAAKVQLICSNVSYSNEVKNQAFVSQLCSVIPELKIVQDADRLDAIGAVGIARMFCYTGAKASDRGLEVSHFHEKLLKLEGMMKTETGKRLARERTRRMEQYLEWWNDEVG